MRTAERVAFLQYNPGYTTGDIIRNRNLIQFEDNQNFLLSTRIGKNKDYMPNVSQMRLVIRGTQYMKIKLNILLGM